MNQCGEDIDNGRTDLKRAGFDGLFRSFRDGTEKGPMFKGIRCRFAAEPR